MQRLMLTPTFRLAIRVILPLAICAGAATIYAGDQARRDTIVAKVEGWKHDFQNRPQFMVNAMEISDVSPETSREIRDVAHLGLPRSSFDLDLPALKASIETLPAVAEAALQVRKGGVLFVGVTERIPVALWHGPDGIELVDPAGAVTGTLGSRLDRSDLPLLAGVGAQAAVPEALALLAVADPVRDRVRGLERIGARRWDLVLDRGQRIMLPEERPVPALERVLALHQVQELLDRDVTVVDMRLASRPTVRLSDGAAEDWRKIRDLVADTGR
tara:strand:+ start:19416 stop:20234 length:819 start_codon:yes stop_codon:yes gene_type:complete